MEPRGSVDPVLGRGRQLAQPAAPNLGQTSALKGLRQCEMSCVQGFGPRLGPTNGRVPGRLTGVRPLLEGNRVGDSSVRACLAFGGPVRGFSASGVLSASEEIPQEGASPGGQ